MGRREAVGVAGRRHDHRVTGRTTDGNSEPLVRWGSSHQDREYAGEMGDPCLEIVDAVSKSEAEAAAYRQGFHSPTGLWAHPLQGGLE